MKYLILFIILIFAGCSQGPDFTQPAVVYKKTQSKNGCFYQLEHTNGGVRGIGDGTIIFKAPCSFADVGDNITVDGGNIHVKEK